MTDGHDLIDGMIIHIGEEMYCIMKMGIVAVLVISTIVLFSCRPIFTGL